jgi:hypothetical protein
MQMDDDEITPLDLEDVFSAEPPPGEPTGDPDRLGRSGHIVFEYHDGRDPYYEVRAHGPIFPASSDGGRTYIGRVYRDEAWMLGMIHDCLMEWDNYVAQYYDDRPRGAPPFTPDASHIATAGPPLAQAGDRLFSAVFLQGDDGLSEIGQLLAGAMETPGQVITFYSDQLFVPWWIIYTRGIAGDIHDDPAGWSPRGFWGYSHLIEHEFIRNTMCPDHRIVLKDTPLQVSLNLDLGLDGQNNAPVTAPVREFFTKRRKTCAPVVRSKSDELGAAMASLEFRDQIVYFCCHCGAQQSPYGGPFRAVLRLTDDKHITPAHLCGWLRDRHLLSNPFVFINACGGGLLSTHFYCSFGSELIRKAANCIVGPGIRIPAVFAGAYAVELLTRFLEPHRHLGPVMRDVTRHLMDSYHTPLGLIYGIYRGLDTRIVVGVD